MRKEREGSAQKHERWAEKIGREKEERERGG